MLCLMAVWFFWMDIDPDVGDVLAQLNRVRSIQYTKTRTNSINAQTELIEPGDVLDRSVERYQILEGYLERVEELDPDGKVVRAMVADYRTGDVIRLDMERRTYTTNVVLKRQRHIPTHVPDQAERGNLAPQTDLANYLAAFTSDTPQTPERRQLGQRAAVGLRTQTMQGQSVWRRSVWIDRESKLPIRTETTFRNAHPMAGASDWVCENFVFDAELPESLFSTRPPTGYTPAEFGKSSGEEGVLGIPLP
jgi:hypothetical protein